MNTTATVGETRVAVLVDCDNVALVRNIPIMPTSRLSVIAKFSS